MPDRLCNKCGATISGGNRFCTKCGQPVAEAAPTPAQPVAPATPVASPPVLPQAVAKRSRALPIVLALALVLLVLGGAWLYSRQHFREPLVASKTETVAPPAVPEPPAEPAPLPNPPPENPEPPPATARPAARPVVPADNPTVSSPQPEPISSPPAPPVPAPASAAPTSGVLHYAGPPIPQNGEVVFEHLPAARLKFTFDRGAWQPLISREPDGTQKLTLRSLMPGLQTNCDVRWEILR